MAYRHGVYISEVPTSVLPPVQADAGIPFIVGTAPVGMADESNVNRPVLCHTYAEAVAAFGYVGPKVDAASGLKKFEYTICEQIYAQFALFGAAPIIIVNVLDPKKHVVSASATSLTIAETSGSAVVQETGIIPSTVRISTAEGATYTAGEDYVLAFDDAGHLVVTSLKGAEGEFKMAIDAELTFAASKTNPAAVTAEDIIGGVSMDGSKSGLELVEDCYPKFRLVPGTIIAPGYSGSSSVAAVMAAKCTGINGVFRAISIVDIPTDQVSTYSAAPAWKVNAGITDTYQIACWPMVALDGMAFHLSTQLAPLMQKVDAENRDVPYVSPSNKGLQIDGTVLADGTEVWLNLSTANYLNGEGVVTCMNFINGWVCWGNRTSCYPGNSDAKDAFIPIRRMFDWIGNTIVETFWSKVDYPLNRRLVDTVVDSANIWLNGLAAQGAILGGRLEFVQAENPTTALIDGIATFHLYVTPPAPARELEFVLEYDVNYLQTLFG